ncbi:hypothetical protein AOLI_G00199340 [Acnodon oligacanthus]
MELQRPAAVLTAVILMVVGSTADPVRLVDGAGLSGRVEVKSHQDEEVVCRELGCGSPLTLQGAFFGEGKHQFGTKEFQCKGTENRLLNCNTSDRMSAGGGSSPEREVELVSLQSRAEEQQDVE